MHDYEEVFGESYPMRGIAIPACTQLGSSLTRQALGLNARWKHRRSRLLPQ